jgi:hypothetical protein
MAGRHVAHLDPPDPHQVCRSRSKSLSGGTASMLKAVAGGRLLAVYFKFSDKLCSSWLAVVLVLLRRAVRGTFVVVPKR